MEGVRDPRPIVPFVVAGTCVWLAVEALTGLCSLLAILSMSGPDMPDPNSWAGRLVLGEDLGFGASFVVLLVAAIFSSIWIYRMTALKVAMVEGTSITPGWAVGWFFVPIMGLFKPFEGIKEAWQASINPNDWPSVDVPAALRIWWGLWIIHGLLDNAIGRLSDSDVNLTAWLSFASAGCAIPMSLLWIYIVRHISRSQSLLLSAAAFR